MKKINTQITNVVLEDDIQIETINGKKISTTPGPNIIPATNENGILDPAWGLTLENISGNLMTTSTYDVNENGKVDVAEEAEKISGNPGSDKIYGTDSNGNQIWRPFSSLQFSDSIFVLNKNYTSSEEPSADSGLLVQRGTGVDDASLIWDETSNEWKIGLLGLEEKILTKPEADSFYINQNIQNSFATKEFVNTNFLPLSGGDINGSLSANIFTGTLELSSGNNTENIQNLVGSLFEGNSEYGVHSTYNSITKKIDFDINDFTITFSGDLSGSVNIDGLSNAEISVNVLDDSHTHDLRYYTKSEIDSTVLKNTGDNILVGSLTVAGTFSTTSFNVSTLTATTLNGTLNLNSGTNKENIQDLVALMFQNGTHNGIYISYDDPAGTLNLSTGGYTLTFGGHAAGSVILDGSNKTVNLTVLNDSHTHDTRYYTKIQSNENYLHLNGGTLSGQLNVTDDLSVTGNVQISGNLTVLGTQTIVNSNIVNIGDNILVLNSDETGIPTQNGGIEIQRGIENNASWIWDELLDMWKPFGASTKVGGISTLDASQIITTRIDADLIFAELQGNSSTATKLNNTLVLTLSGELSGSTIFSGDEGEVYINASIVDKRISSDLVYNNSSIPSSYLSDALEYLYDNSGNSSNIDNMSDASGMTVTDALNDILGIANSKANLSHTHISTEITDLSTILAGKSDVGHTHNQYSLTTHNHDSVYSQLGHTHNSLGTGSDNLSLNAGPSNSLYVNSQYFKIDILGNTEISANLEVASNTTLGTTSSNSLTVNATATFNAPISFTESATLGNGNDTVTVNCGTANNFTVSAQNFDLDSSGNLTVYGNLTVQGTETILNTTNLDIEDNDILLNKNETGAGVTAGTAGIRISRGSLDDAVLYFDEGDDSWYGGIDGGTLKKLGASTIAEIDGLQSALDGKAALNHIHTIGNITDLQTALNGKANSIHTHDVSDVTNALSTLGGTLTGTLTLESFIKRTTASGSAYWMQQDGTGRNHWYWNTSGGTSPTFEVGSEDASNLVLTVGANGGSTNGGVLQHRSASGLGKNAGDPITWTTTIYCDLETFTYKGATVYTSDNLSSDQIRATTVSTAAPTSSDGSDGDIWLQYEA